MCGGERHFYGGNDRNIMPNIATTEFQRRMNAVFVFTFCSHLTVFLLFQWLVCATQDGAVMLFRPSNQQPDGKHLLFSVQIAAEANGERSYRSRISWQRLVLRLLVVPTQMFGQDPFLLAASRGQQIQER